MSSLSGTGGTLYAGGKPVAAAGSWSLKFRTDDELAYGQVRESLDRPEYRFVVLAPITDLDVWSVLLLSDSGQWEISQHGIDYIVGGTRVVTP